MLAWTIYISFAGALAVLLLPKGSPAPQALSGTSRAARLIALGVAAAGLALALAGFLQHRTGQMLEVTRSSWVPSLGIEYHLAADGISLSLLLLTGIVAVCGILFSWNVEHRANEFFAFYLLLIGAVYGVFLSRDLFLLFVFYEIVIVPKYFLIAIWGSTRREYGAMKLALYSFASSALVLLGIVAAYVAGGARSFSLDSLQQAHFSPHFQIVAFPVVFLGFAVLAGMWPFHTWAPTGHVAAPTAASMLLAGVVMKLGAYGCLRVAMTLFPLGLAPWHSHVLGLASWRDVFAVLAIAGILHGALVALVQKDLKFIIGYSSVSHMGFVLLGLMTLDGIGISGAVVQMFSHGILAGVLFAIVGRMVYDRTHSRELAVLGPMQLSRALPFAAVCFVVAGMAAMGLPLFSGFVGEFMIVLGAWRAFPVLALLTGFGIVLGVAYVWRAMQAAFFAEAPATPPSVLPPITLPERVGAAILIGTSVLIGVYPRLLLDIIEPALHAPAFEGLRRGLWP